jgi:hypothetical protein
VPLYLIIEPIPTRTKASNHNRLILEISYFISLTQNTGLNSANSIDLIMTANVYKYSFFVVCKVKQYSGIVIYAKTPIFFELA